MYYLLVFLNRYVNVICNVSYSREILDDILVMYILMFLDICIYL